MYDGFKFRSAITRLQLNTAFFFSEHFVSRKCKEISPAIWRVLSNRLRTFCNAFFERNISERYDETNCTDGRTDGQVCLLQHFRRSTHTHTHTRTNTNELQLTCRIYTIETCATEMLSAKSEVTQRLPAYQQVYFKSPELKKCKKILEYDNKVKNKNYTK